MGLHYMHIKMNKAVIELLLDAFDEILFCKKRQKDVRGTALNGFLTKGFNSDFFYKIPFRISNSIRKNPAATLFRILNPKKIRTTL
jgi:hypothetical protein